jgi:phosphoglucan,water dikinase
VSHVAKEFSRNTRVMARSSANCEDLPELSGAGLYESVAGVPAAGVGQAVRTVWASLWSRRAALSRQEASVPHEQARMAVLIQQMLAPDLSFVLHTVNPINQNRREVYAELAVGLGETLVSGAARGNPYRLVCDKGTGQLKMLAFANFSQALVPADNNAMLARKTLVYSKIKFSRDSEERGPWAGRLSAVARLVETAFGMPMDIEGAIVGDEIYLVQARPQQGLDVTNQPERGRPRLPRRSLAETGPRGELGKPGDEYVHAPFPAPTIEGSRLDKGST